MSGADNKARHTWQVLQKLHDDFLLGAGHGEYAWHEIEKPKTANYPTVAEQISILNSLYLLGAITVQSRGIQHLRFSTLPMPVHTALNGGMGIWFSEQPKFTEVYEEHSKHKTEAIAAPSSMCWITKENGAYFFDGNPIHFRSGTDYAQIFDAVFTLIPNGGSVRYTEIKKLCGFGKTQIQRALTGEKANFFKYVRSINRVPEFGRPLFEAGGKGNSNLLFFYNKKGGQ